MREQERRKAEGDDRKQAILPLPLQEFPWKRANRKAILYTGIKWSKEVGESRAALGCPLGGQTELSNRAAVAEGGRTVKKLSRLLQNHLCCHQLSLHCWMLRN